MQIFEEMHRSLIQIWMKIVPRPQMTLSRHWFSWYLGTEYSETTWAVGIAQLTHHEVQGGGKNPETEGRGIFAPTADRVVS